MSCLLAPKPTLRLICPECGGVMNITFVERLPDGPRVMKHGFTCETCLATAKFPKNVSGKARTQTFALKSRPV